MLYFCLVRPIHICVYLPHRLSLSYWCCIWLCCRCKLAPIHLHSIMFMEALPPPQSQCMMSVYLLLLMVYFKGIMLRCLPMDRYNVQSTKRKKVNSAQMMCCNYSDIWKCWTLVLCRQGREKRTPWVRVSKMDAKQDLFPKLWMNCLARLKPSSMKLNFNYMFPSLRFVGLP